MKKIEGKENLRKRGDGSSTKTVKGEKGEGGMPASSNGVKKEGEKKGKMWGEAVGKQKSIFSE